MRERIKGKTLIATDEGDVVLRAPAGRKAKWIAGNGCRHRRLSGLPGGEGAHSRVAALLRAGRLATTAVTVFELWRGFESDADRDSARRALRGVRVYAVTEAAAKWAAVQVGWRRAPGGALDGAGVAARFHQNQPQRSASSKRPHG
jgi:hypothetical protein